MKYDITDRAHVETAKARISFKDRLLISAGGAQVDTALKYCPPREIADLKVRGAVLLGSSAFTSVTAATLFHLAFGDGGFSPLLAVAGIGVGALQGLIDSFVQYRGPMHARGLAENRAAGLKLPTPESNLSASWPVRALRVAQGATSGFLGGLIFLLAANGADIRAYLNNTYAIENRGSAGETAKIVDEGIARSKDDLARETNELNNLIRTIQILRADDVLRRTSRGRGTTQLSMPAPDTRLGSLEKKLAEETAKRDALKAAVERKENGRNAAIETADLRALTHVAKRSGLSAQLGALGALTRDDPKLLLLLIPILLLSMALELGPLFCSTTYMPSVYAARVALEHFIEVTRLASDAAKRLGVIEDDVQAATTTGTPTDDNATEITVSDEAAKRFNDNELPHAGMNGATPPRRGRGRPRKNGLDHNSREAGHEG
jgi:hypothetical protein